MPLFLNSIISQNILEEYQLPLQRHFFKGLQFIEEGCFKNKKYMLTLIGDGWYQQELGFV